MKHIILIAFVLSLLLLSNSAQAHELKPGWKHIPGGVRKCVYDPDLRRNVCSIHCNNGLLAEYGDWESVAEAFGLKMQPGNYQSSKAALSKIDRVVAQLGAELDAQMAEFRRLTHAAYRG